ncbi:MAG: nuclear transport factor 2 family protein [Pseudomonadota bacterium]
MFRTLTTLAALVVSSTIATADVATNKANAVKAMTDVLAAGDASKVADYFADPYIQHNPLGGSGLAAMTGLVEYIGKGDGLKLQVARVIGEGDLVAMHNVWTGFGPVPLVAFDVFRFNEDGKIVEHWDNLQPFADSPNPSGRTQVDGETEITDLDQTEANKAKVLDLMNRVFIKGEDVDITQYINPAKYLQHNTMAGDGLEGLGKLMKEMAAKGIKMVYTDVPLVVAEGNFVLTGAEGKFGDKPTAFYDLFRLENGLIVEHWDVIADMPSGDLPEGYPGKF